MKVTSRKEWDGNVDHTFERDSFQFVVTIITNKERLVLLIKPETQGYIKPSSMPISVDISFRCRSSQSGYLPFDKHDMSIVTSKSTTYTHTLKSHLSNWMAVGNVDSVCLLINCYAVGIIKTSTLSKSILTPSFAAPSMNTHQSWDNKSEEEEEEEEEEEKDGQIGLLPDAVILQTECEP